MLPPSTDIRLTSSRLPQKDPCLRSDEFSSQPPCVGYSWVFFRARARLTRAFLPVSGLVFIWCRTARVAAARWKALPCVLALDLTSPQFGSSSVCVLVVGCDHDFGGCTLACLELVGESQVMHREARG
jgi:hypothetical protein